MKITLLTVGATQSSYLNVGIEDYTRRISHYLPFDIVTVKDLKASRSTSPDKQCSLEGQRILAMLQPSDMVVLLDERGRELTSREFSGFVDAQMLAGRRRLVFVVGGPYGFSDEVYARADAKISLSRMTFSHEMVRLFFVEQLYRAMTILRGEPYHHD
ncbi:MAG: 23S rRNA (pseudouridine(1915)-N(3))-methyltransferase RlmH [Bacteroides sp.]|nr:23S rRNA (pseudouridine(1915)-N(3))-methyltransferase RlmH [Bacteroides sp.]MCM1413158.1 23S rRNA (pseudouridine(1915)-N(3))-methyltransferase RlmH [Bacteroides sp.]MCM1472100.1 23S rRNA (pseudouridine(1915)-N(3))-methyltransferase RlmH [Bacteroides sp.]